MAEYSLKSRLHMLTCAFAGLLFVGGFAAVGNEPAKPCTSPTNQTVSLTVYHPDGNKLIVDKVPWIDNCTVSLAMMNAKHINPNLVYDTSYSCPWGSFVTNLDGFFEGGDHYWALYVNGSFAQHGMDTQLINAGDKVEWKVQDVNAHSERDSKSHQAVSAAARLKGRLDILINSTKAKK